MIEEIMRLFGKKANSAAAVNNTASQPLMGGRRRKHRKASRKAHRKTKKATRRVRHSRRR